MSKKKKLFFEGIILAFLVLFSLLINKYFFFGLLMGCFFALLHFKLIEFRYRYFHKLPALLSLGFVLNFILLVLPLLISALTGNLYLIFGSFSGLLYYRICCFIEGLYIK